MGRVWGYKDTLIKLEFDRRDRMKYKDKVVARGKSAYVLLLTLSVMLVMYSTGVRLALEGRLLWGYYIIAPMILLCMLILLVYKIKEWAIDKHEQDKKGSDTNCTVTDNMKEML